MYRAAGIASFEITGVYGKEEISCYFSSHNLHWNLLEVLLKSGSGLNSGSKSRVDPNFSLQGRGQVILILLLVDQVLPQ